MAGYEIDSKELMAMANEAAGMEDQSAKEGGNFERYVPKPGPRLCRLVSYIELGHVTRETKYGIKTNDRVELHFECMGKEDMQTYGEGDAARTEGCLLKVRVNKSRSNKSDFQKIKAALSGGREVAHMAQLLGQGFLVTLTAYDANEKIVPKDDPKYAENVKYVNAWSGAKDAKQWNFALPIHIDPMSGETKPYKVPPANMPMRLFVWTNANSKMWHSIYREGTFDKKGVDGNVIETRSLNFWQEDILKAENFPGSPIETVLANEGLLEEALHNAGIKKGGSPVDTGDDDPDLGPAFPSENDADEVGDPAPKAKPKGAGKKTPKKETTSDDVPF